MVGHAILADALIFSMRTHIQIGTPVFSGVPSRGLKNVQPKKVYSAHSEYLSRSMLHVSLHDNLLLSQILTLAECGEFCLLGYKIMTIPIWNTVCHRSGRLFN